MMPLHTLHVFRAPVGGLFRHVVDLARGHRVALAARAEEILGALQPSLALGLSRVAMRRHMAPSDLLVLAHVMRRIRNGNADVVHSHGSKGGAFARLALNGHAAIRVYTPHGSLLFRETSAAGRIYHGTERILMRRSDLYLFESAFSADTFSRKVGTPRGLTRVVNNGVPPEEFERVSPCPEAADVVFIGERRRLKGIDVLIEAIVLSSRPRNAHPVGRELPVSSTASSDSRSKRAHPGTSCTSRRNFVSAPYKIQSRQPKTAPGAQQPVQLSVIAPRESHPYSPRRSGRGVAQPG